jgi:hypothetical protein
MSMNRNALLVLVESAPDLILVEGSTDKNVFQQVINRWGRKVPITITPANGYQNLRAQLGLYLKPGTDIERLGIIVDADVNLITRWESISSAVRNAGYATVPRQPDPQGLVVTADSEGLPRVGIWVMPDNQIPGKLEDFLTMLIPPGDSLIAHARKVVEEIPEKRFRDVHTIKAVIHTWLAWQDEPGTPFDTAIVRRYFPIEGPLATEFLSWLDRVFI